LIGTAKVLFFAQISIFFARINYRCVT